MSDISKNTLEKALREQNIEIREDKMKWEKFEKNERKQKSWQKKEAIATKSTGNIKPNRIILQNRSRK